MKNFVKSVIVELEKLSKRLSGMTDYVAKSADEELTRLYNEAITLVDSIRDGLSDLRFEEHDSD